MGKIQDTAKKERKSLTEIQLKAELIKYFEDGETQKTAVIGKIRQKYKIANDIYRKIYKQTLNEWKIIKENALIEGIGENTKEGIKSGIKTKYERLMNLQNDVERIEKEIEEKKITDYIVAGGKTQKLVRELTPLELAKLRQVKKDIQSEISKIEGDYAPTKQALTDTGGNDKDNPFETLLKRGGKIVINGK